MYPSVAVAKSMYFGNIDETNGGNATSKPISILTVNVTFVFVGSIAVVSNPWINTSRLLFALCVDILWLTNCIGS